jgi:hypothetical protein
MMWPRPLAPKLAGEPAVLGDLIGKEYLKSYFKEEKRFEKLKHVSWKAVDTMLAKVRVYESENEVFDKIKEIYNLGFKMPGEKLERPKIVRMNSKGKVVPVK